MDFKERESLVRRIVGGKFYCSVKYRYDEFNVSFLDPSQDLLIEADWIYRREYDNCVSRGDMMTQTQAIEFLRENGQWSDALEFKLKGLYDDIKQIKSKLNSLKFQKAAQRAAKATLEQGKKKVSELESQKGQLYPSTIESICEGYKRNFIISKITKVPEEFEDLMENPDFLEILAFYYFDKHFITEKQYRELARNEPWRIYWLLSKDSGTPLFRSATQLTYGQYNLVSWSRVYDFAYNSTNRPDDDTVEDDDKFDAWYDEEIDRLDKESKRSAVDNAIGSGAFGGQEVFIPADEEGAKEVYALNDIQGRSRILTRQKALDEKGTLKHADLPDVNMDIKLEVNKMTSQGVLNRSK